ncbi:MAG: lactate utilization protein [Anaerolineaceae bacterium]|nr:lactate utilization protein [Anaerolineaceae bacterium]
MDSKQKILKTLKGSAVSFPDRTAPPEYLSVTSLPDTARPALVEKFIAEAALLNVHTHKPADNPNAIDAVLEIIGGEQKIMAWNFDYIPLPGLAEKLQHVHIETTNISEPSINVGITGADAALAATGSLILYSGNGKPRGISLLPQKHIAILREDQIYPNFEAWIQQQKGNNRNSLRHISNIVVISGPSRAADIAMEQIIGMHGPGELHIILLP